MSLLRVNTDLQQLSESVILLSNIKMNGSGVHYRKYDKFVHYCCSNEAEMLMTLDDIYQVGSFVQITEMHDMGDRMRMVILGHRRYII